MSDSQSQRTIWRSIVGRPYRWQGIAWMILGLFWLSIVATQDSQPWRWVVGVVWLALGLLWLVTAFSD